MSGDWKEVVISVVGLLLGQFMPSYFRKKGENLATKEDIAKITCLQEEVKHQFADLQQESKHQYAMILEESKHRHSVRTLIAAERVATHQQAFVWVHKLLGAHNDDALILECNEWATNNCLYLTPDARKAFFQALGKARARSILLFHNSSGEYDEQILGAWHEIEKAFSPIVEGVELPAFKASDIEEMVQNPDQAAEDEQKTSSTVSTETR